MIRVQKLVRRYGLKTVLFNLDFEVKQGEFVALMGPNGAGKTTLLRILSTLSKPTSGQVTIAGYSMPSQASIIRGRLGLVSHQPLLYGDLSARENLLFYARMYSISNESSRIQHVLGFVGLTNRSEDLVRTYSRGMQQRLAIARAILHDPSVLLLDEPHTGLDQDACAMLDQLLLEVAHSGKTIVMATHELDRVQSLATRFDVLSRGKIAASADRDFVENTGLLAYYRQSVEAR